MASIRKEFPIPDAAQAWEAVRDFGAVHTRLAPGFVTECTAAEEDGIPARDLVFANGMRARELLVGLDEEQRRIAYAIVGGRAKHYNGSLQLVEDGAGARAVWIVDVLPDQFAEPIGMAMDAGAAAMQRALGVQKA